MIKTTVRVAVNLVRDHLVHLLLATKRTLNI